MQKQLPLFFMLLCASVCLQAQQYPLFSNYLLNSYGFNPALAGANAHWDAKATYRTQWVGIDGAPKTQLVSVNGPLNDLGVGAYFFNDTAGRLKRTGGAGTLSYGFHLTEMTTLRLGLGLSAFRFGVEEGNTPETLLMEGNFNTVFDLTAGAFLETQKGFYLGVSAPQILQPTVDLTNESGMDRELVPHFYVMSGYRYQVSEKLSLEPSVLFKYTAAAPLQYDLSVRAIFNQKYWIGGTYRQGAAASGMIGYDLTTAISLAYAYDMTFNDLREGSSGSHEITLGLKFGFPKDTDGDGVLDKKDQCPNVPGLVELDGCPEEAIVEEDNDQDKDGVLDPYDECPYTPGVIENQGCPLNSDRDKDGLTDAIDKCPDEFGLAIHEGCPVEDADKDGVVDAKDKCPQTPGLAINEGCPKASEDERAVLDLAIQNLYFDTNKSVIKEASFNSLDKLAQLLLDRSTYRVKIEGHTDSRGDAVSNYELSKDRSFAVSQYLINKGVQRSQLVVEYYGETRPIVSNMTEDKRQLNRRVEMSFVWD